ncbi:STAS domain-containing protein [Oerskovia sp. M15]
MLDATTDAEATGLPVEIDAHHVTFMDSSGVAFLARLATRGPHRVRVLRAPRPSGSCSRSPASGTCSTSSTRTRASTCPTASRTSTGAVASRAPTADTTARRTHRRRASALPGLRSRPRSDEDRGLLSCLVAGGSAGSPPSRAAHRAVQRIFWPAERSCCDASTMR